MLSPRDSHTSDTLSRRIREHWGIENHLHWQLDVTFREDACRARKNFSARNLNLIRKFSLAILRQQYDNLSLKARRWKFSLRIDYLKQVLGFGCGSPNSPAVYIYDS